VRILRQHNLDASPTSFPQCTVGAFYEWVSACFDLVAMNTKIFSELGAIVGVRTLAYSVCSLVPADRPSSEKTISKSDLQRLTRDDFGWPSDAELDVSKLTVLAKNLANNFMNTFFAERRSRLTLDESVRLSTHVRRNDLHFYIDALNYLPLTMIYPCSLAAVQIGPHLQMWVAARLRSRHAGGGLPQPSSMEEGNWIEMTGIPLIAAKGTIAEGGATTDAEGGGAETGHGAEHGAEGGLEQDAKTAHDERVERTVGLSMTLPRPALPPKPTPQSLKTLFAHQLRK
jgi:hypothetical protein